MTSPPSEGRRIVLLGALAAFGPMSVDMYLPAFPALARDFRTSTSTVAFTLSAFFVGLAVGQLVYGPLADRFGRKGPLLVGLALYVLASVACAFAPNIATLVVLRALQAFGACAGLVMSRAMVRDLFDVQAAARVFSLLMLVMGLAPILAPTLGGFMLNLTGWQGIFGCLAGFGLLVLAAVLWGLPETLPPRDRTAIGVGQSAKVYASLLKHRAFLGFSLSGAFASAGMFAYIAGSPFVFMTLHGIPSGRYGLLFGANATGLIGASQVNAWLVRRQVPATRILGRALIGLAVLGALLAGHVTTGLGGFPAMLVTIFGFVATLGLVMPNATACAMGSQRTGHGQASALVGTLQFGIATVSGSVVGAWHDGTARPMGWTIAVCGAAALTCGWRTMRPLQT
jgi:DHA1 family bicyclomycin/chloramphenicol resistance-like MFS transporter